ncbi:ATP-binding protein [Flavobacterium aquidurense]|uniref:tetratricopeptide repeat-containing sensor histidine kinase n=1 Tax=Flavobacterium aquidurense TaxID=362413 RepID=UPI002861DCF1|nr:ATP-binding protein [Flavobacterium aquidurense]MDR7371324.1 signal transduction histidine kinase [Flavobacterium aquidurense]
MLRSPIFVLIILLLLFSCKEKKTNSIQPNPNKKEASFLQAKAISCFQKNSYDSSFYYFNKSKIAFEKLKDSSNVAFSLLQMCNIQQINGDYYGSKETLTESLPYINHDDIYLVAAYNFFGIADKELSLYDDAISYYNEAIKSSKNPVAKQAPINNMAVIYRQQKKYDQAIVLFKSILDKKTSENRSQKSKARVLDNLGFTYYKKGLYEKGLLLMNQGLELRNKLEDSYGSIESYLHFAEYYAENDATKSNQYAQLAYQNATNLNSIDERLEALSFLMTNNSINNTIYAQKYVHLNDSIIKIRNNFKNKFAKIKYDSKKEKDENQQLRLEKAENLLSLQKAKYQKIVAGIGIIFLIIVIVILIRYYRNQSRIEKIKTSYDTETRIAKNIHDELANDVFYAITFAQTQSLTKEDIKETLLQKLNHIYTRVRGISRENNTIETGTNYSIHLKEMLSTYNSDSTNIIINSIEKVNWEIIDDIKKITIHRVLQELMVNMKKHSDASLVVLKFESTANTIEINYTDNGKGCPKDKIIKNGLQNMENRIQAIKGTITFDSEPEKGFKVKISMPK